MKKKHRFSALLALILVFCTVWGISLIKCEILTHMHADEFTDGWEQTYMLSEPENVKVLRYSEQKASVYYVDEEGGTVLAFEKQDGCWILSKWEACWSKMGSADDIIWPYIR